MHRFTAAVLTMLAVSACAELPVGVRRVGPDRGSRQIGVNALVDADEPSAETMSVLRREALADAWDDDRDATIARLAALAISSHDRDVAFAVSELAFAAARAEDEEPRQYFTSACFAWFCLFDGTLGPEFNEFDPRRQLCTDLYNRALSGALKDASGAVVLTPGPRSITGGTVAVDVDVGAVFFDAKVYGRLLDAADYELHGLNNRYRLPGLGIAVIAQRNAEGAAETTSAYLSKPHCVGGTVFMRLDDGIDGLTRGPLHATLELHQPMQDQSVQVAGKRVPLQIDFSAVIAYYFNDARLFDLEFPALFGGTDVEDFTGMYSVGPYQPDKVPVVLVHGTSSSLGRWASLLNDLLADRAIREHFQFWLYTYQSGQPVPISGERLREVLVATRHEVDPEGKNRAFDHTVLIGHSQGGLLAREAVVVDPTHARWNALFDRPLEDLELEDDSRQLVKRVFFAEPLPFVTRTIYVCAPHHGSYQADRWITQFVGSFITLPRRALSTTQDILTRNSHALRTGLNEAKPSALNGMRTSNPYLLALAALDAAPGVHQHTICGIDDDSEPPDGVDGVVAYKSAHLEGADSEFVVRDGHSCQSNPLVVREVRRILLEHLAEYEHAPMNAAAAPKQREP